MLGAILGDIVGSPYEFDHNNYKHKDFPLLSKKSHFTDDTVMTVAVARGLIAGKGIPERTFEETKSEMRIWVETYPHAGYGGMFRRWLHAENPNPYGSFGNGSAMRVSAAGWLFDTLDKTLEMAKVTAEVTHNHPEGIKGTGHGGSDLSGTHRPQQNTRLRIVCKAQYMGGCGFVVVCSHCQNRSKHNFCGVPSSRYRI